MAATMGTHDWRPVVNPSGLLQLVGMLPLVVLAPALALPALAQLARVPASAVSVQPQVPSVAAADPVVRVLVSEGPTLVLSAAKGPLLLRDGAGLVLAELRPDQELRVAVDPFGASAVRWQLGHDSPVALAEADLWLEPAAPEALLQLQQRQFRGQLQLRAQLGTLLAINHVSLESYLPSVVGSEMPASWPQPALRAQAVAARTYALRQRRPTEPFDLRATVSSQVYRGLESETESTRQAVAATRGQVLTYDGRLIDAVFHSSSGGSTEASGDLWAQQLPYLVAVPDFDEQSPVRSWQERFEPDQLQRLFAEIGGITDLTVLARSGTGRLRQLRLQGSAGVLELSGAQLRQRLGLRSTLIELELVRPQRPLHPQALRELPMLPALPELPESDQGALPTLVIRGRGFGHGIGMSQWGAYGLAQRGASYNTILSHYYPGTQLDAFRGP